VISRRRGSLNPGMVEASMMIKLNKDFIVRDPTLVEEHRQTWKDFIPKRPDDPADYYDVPEEEDADDDDGSISAQDRQRHHPFSSDSDSDDELHLQA
jgi:hypothetical protein